MNHVAVAILVVLGGVGIILLVNYRRHRRAALAHIQTIRFKILADDGHPRARELHLEAAMLIRYYGFRPKEIGFATYEQFRQAAVLSLERYIAVLEALRSEEFQVIDDLRAQVNTQSKPTELFSEIADHDRAVNVLVGHLRTLRKKLAGFKATYS